MTRLVKTFDVKTFDSEPESIALLNSLNALSFFSGDEAIFLQTLVNNLAWLCHAPAMFYVQKEEHDWQLQACFIKTHTLDELLMQTALHLHARAELNGFAHEPLHDSVFGIEKPLCLVINLLSHDDALAFLCVIIDRQAHSLLNECIVRLRLLAHLPAIYYQNCLYQRSHPSSELASTELLQTHQLATHILSLAALLIKQTQFHPALVLLVNELAARFQCTRVQLGWRDRHYVKIMAMSHVDKFERSTNRVQWIEAVFEEACDQNAELIFPYFVDHQENQLIDFAHKNYVNKTLTKQLVSLPLRNTHHEPIAVVCCERDADFFTEKEIDALRLLLNQITPWLEQLHFHQQWMGKRLFIRCQQTCDHWFNTQQSVRKLGMAMLTGLGLFILLGSWSFRIEGIAVVETDNLAYLSAPFEGYVANVTVHAGDHVKQGDVLMEMDTQELFLKESEAYADVQRFIHESEKARGFEQHADMLIAQARVQQAQAKLEEIRYFLQRATLKAPFDGIIIEGDKEDLLGVPIAKGDTLFKIARLSGMYLKVMVDERDIDALFEQQSGNALLLSQPNTSLSVHSEKIIPIAHVESQGQNSFSIKVTFDDAQITWIRPGMTGVVKLDAGKRPILWLLTHRAIDYLRFHFWL